MLFDDEYDIDALLAGVMMISVQVVSSATKVVTASKRTARLPIDLRLFSLVSKYAC